MSSKQIMFSDAALVEMKKGVDRLADAITGLGESLTALQSSPGGTGTHYFMRGATTALVTAHDVAATDTVYAANGGDGTLALFDFPNPNNTAETRNVTNVPVQRLYFMNSSFVERQAGLLAKRFEAVADPGGRIRAMYRAAFTRTPDDDELRLGMEFVKTGNWNAYAQALLSSNEFLFVD